MDGGKHVRLQAADGHRLGAVFYAARRPRAPRRAVVLHCGAGIPALAYRHFASFLAEWGVPALTYDYRGIGLSRPERLRGFEASTADWAEYDSAAAIAWLRERFGADEVIGVSHSIGALTLLAAPNAAEQARIVLICPHTAYYGDYRPRYRLPMALLWHGLMPLVTRQIGYFPGRRLRLGDDLPAGIALEWAERRGPDLRPVGEEPYARRARRLLDLGARLSRPALAATVSDDAFATPAGAQRLLSYFPALQARHIVITPAEARVGRLGHFGFFRREAGVVLWPRLLTQLVGEETR